MLGIPNFSKEALQQLVNSHDAVWQMEGMAPTRASLNVCFDQLKKLDERQRILPTNRKEMLYYHGRVRGLGNHFLIESHHG